MLKHGVSLSGVSPTRLPRIDAPCVVSSSILCNISPLHVRIFGHAYYFVVLLGAYVVEIIAYGVLRSATVADSVVEVRVGGLAGVSYEAYARSPRFTFFPTCAMSFDMWA